MSVPDKLKQLMQGKPVEGAEVLDEGIQPASTNSALDVQVGGGHYKSMAIQPVQYIHANQIPFMEGSVIKYVSRHRAKNGAADIKKAIHFLNLILELDYPEAKGTPNV